MCGFFLSLVELKVSLSAGSGFFNFYLVELTISLAAGSVCFFSRSRSADGNFIGCGGVFFFSLSR